MLCSSFTPYLPIRTLNLVLRLLLRVTVLIGLAVLRKQRFPFHDTGNFAENGVSLLWMVCLGVVLSAAEVVFVCDTGYSLEKGVSLHECSGKQRFPFHDTGYFAENGVSLLWMCVWVSLSSAADVVFVRDTGYSLEKGVSLLWMVCLGVVLSAAEVVFVCDTGYSLEKGVSLHECTGNQRFPFHDTGNFAENGVSLL